MRTVRRLFYRDIASAVAFVAVAFLALFYFIDFVDEVGGAGARPFSLPSLAFYSLLRLPGHLYELAPIAVLIGAIYALSRLAQTSQYTILRTSGLGPSRALGLLMGMGLLFGLATFLIGDYVTPPSERLASDLRAMRAGSLVLGRAGAWLKERTMTADGERSYSINIATADADAHLRGVRIFEFDGDGRLLRRLSADRATVGDDGLWRLENVDVTRWADAISLGSVGREQLPELRWQSTLTAQVVASAVLPVTTMSTVDLYRYIGHLAHNDQAAQDQQILFWRRALYPFACLVMMGLALPFAYLQARAGGVSLKVFAGIMLGISFLLLNNVFRFVGVLGNWTPWVVAATPSAVYLLVSLLAFGWLVRYR